MDIRILLHERHHLLAVSSFELTSKNNSSPLDACGAYSGLRVLRICVSLRQNAPDTLLHKLPAIMRQHDDRNKTLIHVNQCTYNYSSKDYLTFA